MDWLFFGHLPRRDVHQEVLENSLYDQPSFKQVIAPSGREMLSPMTFDNSIEQKECPIDMEEFQEGEELLKLPCEHIFRKSSILHWLENRNAQCPICRYQLPYIEMKNDVSEDSSGHSTGRENTDELDDDIAIGRSNLLLSLSQLYGLRHYS
jgi:hypothetical protein